jgi:hypothetical protein
MIKIYDAEKKDPLWSYNSAEKRKIFTVLFVSTWWQSKEAETCSVIATIKQLTVFTWLQSLYYTTVKNPCLCGNKKTQVMEVMFV